MEEAGPWWWDDFETEHCQFCPFKDTCVVEPEEVEEDCDLLRGSAPTAKKVKTE